MKAQVKDIDSLELAFYDIEAISTGLSMLSCNNAAFECVDTKEACEFIGFLANRLYVIVKEQQQNLEILRERK